MWGFMLQPTTWRLWRSSTAAKYNQPSSVGMHVMSLDQTWFGAAGLKSRCSRSGATGKLCRLSVVTTNLRLPRARMPCRLMRRRTRSLPTRCLTLPAKT
jgi:hypothetical protein